MDTLIQDLFTINQALQLFLAEATESQTLRLFDALVDCANTIGRSWNGSWIGYHANIYYKDLKPPPPGAHFSREWGFIDTRHLGTSGEWVEYDHDFIIKRIEDQAKQPDFSRAVEIANKAKTLLNGNRDEIISILEANKPYSNDAYFQDLLEKAKQLKIPSATDYIQSVRPNLIWSRDSLALSQGVRVPPLIAVLSKVASLHDSVTAVEILSDIAQKLANHLGRISQVQVKMKRLGNHVFIGHGRSSVWKDLKGFVQDRLKLQWDEFNRVPVAGITNINRLSEMLNSASFAFLVMTAEDEQPDGKIHARMNVIHEAGLFQGRLGFNKAIILLEKGCEEFSNIHGLGQIHFPKGNIKAVFEEIRATLEREEIISASE